MFIHFPFIGNHLKMFIEFKITVNNKGQLKFILEKFELLQVTADLNAMKTHEIYLMDYKFSEFYDNRKRTNKHLDEPFTCGKDELRDLWAYYNAPEYYLLYKNEQSIYEYLIQSYYPDYTPQYSEPVDFSGYLSIKYISLIILVLLL